MQPLICVKSIDSDVVISQWIRITGAYEEEEVENVMNAMSVYPNAMFVGKTIEKFPHLTSGEQEKHQN